MPALRVLMPLPRHDFDPTEVAISWQVLGAAGIKVLFATVDGQPSSADPLMLDGQGLDLWSALPGIRKFKLLGLALRASRGARKAYAELLLDEAFAKPLRFSQLKPEQFDGLLLAGGHRAQGMRPYLENKVLQQFVSGFFASNKPVAAICHGVVLAARSRRADGRSVLFGRKTTALPWQMERDAWNLTRFLGRVWDPDYYRTYLEKAGEPEGYHSVESEVTRALARPTDFLNVPLDAPDYWRKSTGLYRDSKQDSRPAWVVCDGNYISARWPGDAYTFAQLFVERLHGG